MPQLFQFLLFALAAFTCLSRVTDNKHHPTDVLSGAILGTSVAIFTFYYLTLFYKRYNFKNKYDSVQTVDEVHNQEVDDNENENKRVEPSNKRCMGIKSV